MTAKDGGGGDGGLISLRLRRTLAVGVTASIFLILAGLVSLVFVDKAELRSPVPIVGLVNEGNLLNPTPLLTLGVLALILTPTARVFVALIFFSSQRDRVYAALSALVLGILMLNYMVLSNL